MRIKRNSLHESQRKRHLTRNAESNAPLWPEAAIARQESVWLEKAARELPELAAILFPVAPVYTSGQAHLEA